MAAASVPFAKAEGHVLVASSRAEFRRRVLQKLPHATSIATEAAGGADALVKLGQTNFGTLLLDCQLDDLDVDELLATIRLRHPRVNVVVLESEQAECGVQDPPQHVAESTTFASVAACGPAAQTCPPARRCGAELAPESRASEALPGVIGTSGKMQHVYRLARLVASRSTRVLVVGDTGTGKELIARGIHELSPRKAGPFVVVNCAAIPETLLEAELFGFTRGAFTGAFQSRLGRIHAAHGGTLLLDEVGELPLSMQAKLLRFVQEGEVQRLGSADIFRVDARVIAATNADLLSRIRERQFREDLYYRLAVFPIALPPLRDRFEDILPLAQHFLDALGRDMTSSKTFSPEAATALQKHLWPGNVRELQHNVERGFVMSDTNAQIQAADLCMCGESS